jgi:hypothetical protein
MPINTFGAQTFAPDGADQFQHRDYDKFIAGIKAEGCEYAEMQPPTVDTRKRIRIHRERVGRWFEHDAFVCELLLETYPKSNDETHPQYKKAAKLAYLLKSHFAFGTPANVLAAYFKCSEASIVMLLNRANNKAQAKMKRDENEMDEFTPTNKKRRSKYGFIERPKTKTRILVADSKLTVTDFAELRYRATSDMNSLLQRAAAIALQSYAETFADLENGGELYQVHYQ